MRSPVRRTRGDISLVAAWRCSFKRRWLQHRWATNAGSGFLWTTAKKNDAWLRAYLVRQALGVRALVPLERAEPRHQRGMVAAGLE